MDSNNNENSNERRLQQEEQQHQNDTTTSTCCAEAFSCSSSTTKKRQVIRIATWSYLRSTVQSYVDAYHRQQQQQQQQQVAAENNDEFVISALTRTVDLSSEVVLDLQLQTGLYDAFVMPPTIVGNIFQHGGLADMTMKTMTMMTGSNDDDRLLPYHRKYMTSSVLSLDGTPPLTTPLPFLGGDQLVLLYRKDILAGKGLTRPPATWAEFGTYSELLHDPASELYGNCIGRVSLRTCHISSLQSDDDLSCRASTGTLTSFAMMVASQAQTSGSQTGYLFDVEGTGKLRSLLEGPFENALLWLGQQMSYGAPNQRDGDISMNYELFQRGKCAMTIVNDVPPISSSMSENIAVAHLPGSTRVLDRTTMQMVDCTPVSCPHGEPHPESSNVLINRVPFGTLDGGVLGGISNFISHDRQRSVQSFYEFVSDNPNLLAVQQQDQNETEPASWRHQPFRESGLDELTAQGGIFADFAEVVRNATSHPNVAVPQTYPTAFDFLRNMDVSVNAYLDEAEFTATARSEARSRTEENWERNILSFNSRGEVRTSDIPLESYYEKSLGIFQLEPATSDWYIGTSLRIVGYSIAGVSLMSSLFFAAWVFFHRSNRVVRSSQPAFLWMLCFGTFVLALSILMSGLEDDVVSYDVASRACMADKWLYYLGTTITFSALLLSFCCPRMHMLALMQIFSNAKKFVRVTVKVKDVLVPFAVLFSVNVIVLTVWTLVDPLQWERQSLDGDDDDEFVPGSFRLVESSTFGHCSSEHQAVYSWILFGCNLLVAVFALIQAYESRKISTEFSESLWINAALVCIVQVWLVGIPVLQLLDNSPAANFFARTGIVFVTCMSTLLLLFVPKMRYLREELQKERMKDARRQRGSSRGTSVAASMWEGDQRVTITGLESPHRVPSNNGRSNGQLNREEEEKQQDQSEDQCPTMTSKADRRMQARRLYVDLKMAEDRNKILKHRVERLEELIAAQQELQQQRRNRELPQQQQQQQPTMAAVTTSSMGGPSNISSMQPSILSGDTNSRNESGIRQEEKEEEASPLDDDVVEEETANNDRKEEENDRTNSETCEGVSIKVHEEEAGE